MLLTENDYWGLDVEQYSWLDVERHREFHSINFYSSILNLFQQVVSQQSTQLNHSTQWRSSCRLSRISTAECLIAWWRHSSAMASIGDCTLGVFLQLQPTLRKILCYLLVSADVDGSPELMIVPQERTLVSSGSYSFLTLVSSFWQSLFAFTYIAITQLKPNCAHSIRRRQWSLLWQCPYLTKSYAAIKYLN